MRGAAIVKDRATLMPLHREGVWVLKPWPFWLLLSIISENFPSARPLDVSGRGILLMSRVGRLPEAVSTADGRKEGKCSLFISLFY